MFYLQKILTGFLFGLGFCLAFVIADAVRSELQKNFWEEAHHEQVAEDQKNLEDSTLDAEKVLVTNARLVKNARHAKVAIRVENRLGKPFGSAFVLVKLADTDGLFGECKGDLGKFDTGEVKERIIDCSEYLHETFPEDVRVEAKVTSVSKYRFGV